VPGRELECSDFAYYEDAQAASDANRPDVARLDPDRDGIACGQLPRRPRTDAGLVRALGFAPNFASSREMIAGGDRGLYRSRDGGRIWEESRVPANTPAIRSVAYSPRTGTIFAAAYGEEGGTGRRGILRSRDGGTTFEEYALVGRSVGGLYFSPDGSALYATTRPSGGEAGTLYRSTDEGQSWAPVLNLGSQTLVFTSLVFAPGGERVMYVGASGFPLAVPTPVPGSRQLPVQALACPSAAEASDNARPYTFGTAFRSDDDGRTWVVDDQVDGGGRLRSVWSLASVAQGGTFDLYAGTDCGVLTKRNGAGTWRQLSPADPASQRNYAVDLVAPRPNGVLATLCPRARVESPPEQASIEWRDCITSVALDGSAWRRVQYVAEADAAAPPSVSTIGTLDMAAAGGTPAIYLGVDGGQLFLYSIPKRP
jgi:photosystem II stability/assembly factor-like uncharacterized protein